MKNALFNSRNFFLNQDLREKKNYQNHNKIFIIFIFLLLPGCCVSTKIPDPFPISSDVILGKNVKDAIINDPSTYPILDTTTNQEMYDYIRDLTHTILNSGLLFYKDIFSWEVRIIKVDSIINAFATPGGYIFIYTGLLKFCESEDELMGVLGHEMAHSDNRHTTKMLIKIFGLEFLSKIIRGEASPSEIENVTKTLIYLRFSRCDEKQSDYYSVKYLCNSSYNAAGLASLFQKMLDRPSPPEFLSTHPSYSHRIRDINKTKTKLGCIGVETYKTRYQQKITLLP